MPDTIPELSDIAVSTFGPYPGINVGASAVNPYGISNTSIASAVGIGTYNSGLSVSGDANFDGAVKIKGVDIVKLLESIHDRLAILTPDPKKLEKFQALKKAYDHYKLLETLVSED